jgi:tRNA-specific 2-thiouridylase
MSERKRVVVGMSGGVDSSVAAALFLKEFYDVIGITLKLWPQDCASIIEDKCCGPQAMMDARAVAAHLGMPHYVLDETPTFTKEVIDYFTAEYQSGRTPNPCVLCNERLKFGNLLRKAQGLGADYVATGHYARVEKTGQVFALKRSVDVRKDQSYFLFTLGQTQLAHTLMPLGGLSKAEVRQMAKEFGLRTHDKDESQDICFVPENDYGAFLKTHLGQTEFQAGEIVHRDGRVLGKHEGIELYTIGQRKGINVGYPKPLYVLDIDPTRRRVIVGDDDELWHSSLIAERSCWGAQGPLAQGTEVLVKIRHSHTGAQAKLYPEENGCVRVEFLEPQRAITPGQATVFYNEDCVVGGGWIAREKFIGKNNLEETLETKIHDKSDHV